MEIESMECERTKRKKTEIDRRIWQSEVILVISHTLKKVLGEEEQLMTHLGEKQ